MVTISVFLTKAKKFYIYMHRAWALIRKERTTPYDVSLKTKLSCWRFGFLKESHGFYDWKSFDKSDFFSDFERFVFAPDINRTGSIIVDDKLVYRNVIGAFLPVPENIGLLTGGTLERSDLGRLSTPEELLEEFEIFVAKPIRGGGGASIFVFERCDNAWLLNGCEKTHEEIFEILCQLPRCMVEMKIENGDYSQKIYPFSLNTLRVLTMVDPKSGESFIAQVVHRFGTATSIPVDNWTRGGLSVSVDIESGRLGKGATYPIDGRMRWLSEHPETGALIEGVIVPGWEKIKTDVLSVASTFSHLPYIGWDVVAREDGYVVLEGNSNTDVNLLQIHAPLLRNPRVKEFFKHHNSLSRWR